MEHERKYFSTIVENEARELVKNISHKSGSLSLTTILEQEIALTVEQIDRLRQLNKNQLRSLLRTECYVDTDIMQMEARLRPEDERRFEERDKFHKQLLGIETERRKLAVFYDEKMRTCQKQLLALMQKHGQLSIHKYMRNAKQLKKLFERLRVHKFSAFFQVVYLQICSTCKTKASAFKIKIGLMLSEGHFG